MKKLVKHSGLTAVILGGFSENQINRKLEQANSSAADSLALAREMERKAGTVPKREAKLIKKQARLLRRQSAIDANQARLLAKQMKLARKF